MNSHNCITTTAKAYQGLRASHIFITSTVSKPPLYPAWIGAGTSQVLLLPSLLHSSPHHRDHSPQQPEGCIHNRRQTPLPRNFQRLPTSPKKSIFTQSTQPIPFLVTYHFCPTPHLHPTLSSHTSSWALCPCNSLCQQSSPRLLNASLLPGILKLYHSWLP